MFPLYVVHYIIRKPMPEYIPTVWAVISEKEGVIFRIVNLNTKLKFYHYRIFTNPKFYFFFFTHPLQPNLIHSNEILLLVKNK